MKPTIAQFLKIKKFPFTIKVNGNEVYREESTGRWYRSEYDSDGNRTYFENSNGQWIRGEFNSNGNQTYYRNSGGFWIRAEFDSSGNQTYYEDSYGTIKGTKKPNTCDGKTVTIDGVTYKLTEVK